MSDEKKWIPFYVEEFPKNREENRKAKFEIKRNTEKVIELEFAFIDILFSETDPLTYSELYNKFSDLYIKMIEWMRKKNMIRYTKVNEIYFKILYYPIEINPNRP